jgi:hypothetical protein
MEYICFPGGKYDALPGSKSELHAVVIELGEEGDVKSLYHSIFGKGIFK